MCAKYAVSRAGFYRWQKRDVSAHAKRDAELLEKVHQAHQESHGYYGSPRVTHALKNQGIEVGRGRIARLMRHARLKGHGNGLFRSRVGTYKFFSAVPNTIRDVNIDRVDQVWIGDVTYLKVSGQWRYFATIMDRYSRRIIGWSLANHRTAQLTIDALNHAVRNRKPAKGVYFHSDRGIEYAALEYKARLKKHGFIQSMNRPGSMNDNAHMESFFHSLKVEGLYKKTFTSDQALSDALVTYVQFYNQKRLHSSLGYKAPAVYECVQTYQSSVH